MKQETDYISGWEALNIPSENGLIADWHPLYYFNKKQDIKKYSFNEILGNSGIKKICKNARQRGVCSKLSKSYSRFS